jgi:hypothetical protein
LRYWNSAANNQVVSTPRIPPEIARKMAALKAAAPAPGAAPRVTVTRVEPAPARPPGGVMGKVAAAGWLLALVAGAAAVGEFYLFEQQKSAALAEQAAGYDAQIAQLKAAAAAQLQKIQDDTAASQLIMQTELDFQRMPELPLETTFRAGQVLYVESRLDEPFTCKVRLFRPSNNTSREVDFNMKARTYQDLAAIDTWLFAKGDKVEFVKSGFKPRSLVVP